MPAPLPPLPKPDDPPGSFLFSDETIKSLTDEETRHGRYTLARLPAAKRESILALLKERRPYRDIARLVSVAFETVQTVAQAHAGELEQHYRDFPKQLRRINAYLADRLERNVDSFPVQSIPLGIKLIGETAALMEGQATSRIEHTHAPAVSAFEEYERFVSQIEKRCAGKVIDPGPEMHYEPEKRALIDAPRDHDQSDAGQNEPKPETT
jgi:hypothetical protein